MIKIVYFHKIFTIRFTTRKNKNNAYFFTRFYFRIHSSSLLYKMLLNLYIILGLLNLIIISNNNRLNCMLTSLKQNQFYPHFNVFHL